LALESVVVLKAVEWDSSALQNLDLLADEDAWKERLQRSGIYLKTLVSKLAKEEEVKPIW